MLKNRLIAVLIMANGQVVQSIKFKHTNVIHSDPVQAIEAFNDWAVDEIVVLNVTRSRESKSTFMSFVDLLSEKCFVPLSAGGWIESVDEASQLISSGADKIVVNTAAFQNPELITEIAHRHGSQAVVVSIDVKKNADGSRKVYINRGREETTSAPDVWACEAVSCGAGEIFFNSIDHDGNRNGYDVEGIRLVVNSVKVPVIAFGGVQHWDHLIEGLSAGATAVAAANIFHYSEHSILRAKKYLIAQGQNFRSIE